ncbi:hypothetical protein NDU88_002299 [Pleurodeles waltl]|uniref:Uncharacterized protein n=1 Tax=Pleurodeles waltl TaxID=8319 RepID=A0AAV7SEX1_PLEWA|nr:hypothetical protein NDU88_002299 [Pleurodeles waltl]
MWREDGAEPKDPISVAERRESGKASHDPQTWLLQVQDPGPLDDEPTTKLRGLETNKEKRTDYKVERLTKI